METFYKGYRIVTTLQKAGRHIITSYDIYQGKTYTPQPNRYEAAGYVIEDWGLHGLDMATRAAKDLIDAGFVTQALLENQKVSRYV